jgi:hypothetical protein
MAVKNKKELILLAVFLVPAVILLIFWSKIPDQIPMHYNIGGGFGNVTSKLHLFTVLLPSYLFFLLVDIYARKTNPEYQQYEKFVFIFRLLVILVAGSIAMVFMYNGMYL